MRIALPVTTLDITRAPLFLDPQISPTALGPDMEDDPQPELAPPSPPQPRRSLRLSVLLFIASCLSTCFANGWEYSAALMTTLLAHELGHFFQAMRYGVPATLPYFIPFPFSPIGTMGAVIFIPPGMGDRRALFDIGISGPLAGLVPALIFSVLGLHWSEVVPLVAHPGSLELGEPLLFKVLGYWIFGDIGDHQTIALHPVAFAGWVGILITALNLFPIGQLDGGHVLYALLRRGAHGIAQIVLAAAVVGVIISGYWGWSLMLMLLMLIGPKHPPTANDDVPLGPMRIVLGWLALLFVIIGFTPTPFVFGSSQ
jgi:membrane-associated protease RseP (regulator of RpoE activity)